MIMRLVHPVAPCSTVLLCVDADMQVARIVEAPVVIFACAYPTVLLVDDVLLIDAAVCLLQFV